MGATSGHFFKSKKFTDSSCKLRSFRVQLNNLDS
jgi:hypothetical protein